MKAFGIMAPDGLRKDLRDKFVARPIDGISPDETADLIVHAIDEALAAIDRTALRAPSEIAQFTIYSIAIAEAARGFRVINEQNIASIVDGLMASRRAGATNITGEPK